MNERMMKRILIKEINEENYMFLAEINDYLRNKFWEARKKGIPIWAFNGVLHKNMYDSARTDEITPLEEVKESEGSLKEIPKGFYPQKLKINR